MGGAWEGGEGRGRGVEVWGVSGLVVGIGGGGGCLFWRGGRRDVLNSNGDWTPLLCNTRMRGRVSTACGEMRRGDHAGGGLRGWVGPCFYPMDGAVGGPRDGWWNQQHHHQHFVSRGDFYLTVAMDRDSLGDGIHLGLRLSHCCSADFCGGKDRDSELRGRRR